ncbi:MAG: hypothetical protein LQ338_007559 [Usnochroma carphineum]|nr:MAG: hypothetical protein LQ338_007559 [Usnochroma carphineum]
MAVEIPRDETLLLWVKWYGTSPTSVPYDGASHPLYPISTTPGLRILKAIQKLDSDNGLASSRYYDNPVTDYMKLIVLGPLRFLDDITFVVCIPAPRPWVQQQWDDHDCG